MEENRRNQDVFLDSLIGQEGETREGLMNKATISSRLTSIGTAGLIAAVGIYCYAPKIAELFYR